MNKPTISAIIPAHNAELTLLSAASSVLNQSFKDIELIIVDDGSSDRTLEIARSISDQRVSVLSQRNSGPGAARNVGLNAASGRWVAFLDADDTWELDFFSTALDTLSEYPQILFYFGKSQSNTATIPQSLPFSKQSPYVFKANRNATTKSLRRQIELSLCVMLGDRKCIQLLGGYYEKNKCTYGEDSVLSFLILWLYPVIKSPKVVHTYNQSEAGLSLSRHTNVQARAMVVDSDYLYQRLPHDSHRAAHKYISYLASIDAYRLAKVGKSTEGYQLIKENQILNYAYQPRILLSLFRFVFYTVKSQFKYRA